MSKTNQSSVRALLAENSGFTSLWFGQTLSRLGNYVYAAAISVLAYQVSGSGSGVALVLGAFSVVQLALILLGGVVADRLPRRLVIGATDLLAVLVVGGLGVWVAYGRPSLWALVGTSGLLGALAALHLPAYRAVVPEVVSERDLPAASALSALVNPMTIVVGPTIGAALMASSGTALCLLIDAGSFATAVLCLLPALRPLETGPSTEDRPARRGSMISDVRAGLEIIRAVPVLCATISTGAVAVACVDAPLTVLLPLLAAREGWGAWMVGATAAAIGLGTAISAPLMVRIPDRLTARAHGWAMAAAGLPLLVGAFSSTGWLVASAVYGVLGGARYIRQSLVQQRAPKEALGRVFSVDNFTMLSLTPVMYAVVGAATSWLTPKTLIAGGALLNLTLVACLIGRGTAYVNAPVLAPEQR